MASPNQSASGILKSQQAYGGNAPQQAAMLNNPEKEFGNRSGPRNALSYGVPDPVRMGSLEISNPKDCASQMVRVASQSRSNRRRSREKTNLQQRPSSSRASPATVASDHGACGVYKSLSHMVDFEPFDQEGSLLTSLPTPERCKTGCCEKFVEFSPKKERAERGAAEKALKNAMSSTIGHAALEQAIRNVIHHEIDIEPARAESFDRLYGEGHLQKAMSSTTGHAALEEVIKEVAHLRIDLQPARAESSMRAAAEKKAAIEKAAAEKKEKRCKLWRSFEEQERRRLEERLHLESALSSTSEISVIDLKQELNMSSVEAGQQDIAQEEDEAEKLLTNFLSPFCAQRAGMESSTSTTSSTAGPCSGRVVDAAATSDEHGQVQPVAVMSESQRCCWEWLVGLDGEQGALKQYWEKLVEEFDGQLTQIMAVRIQREPGTPVLGGVDPLFFEVLGVERMEHKLLFASGIEGL